MTKLLSRLLTLLLTLTLLLGIGIAAYLIWWNTTPPAPQPLQVAFRSVEAGDIVTVSLQVRGAYVTRAELWAENQLIAREKNPNPAPTNAWTVAWQWAPPAPGVYPLAARAFDQEGHYAGTTPFELVVPPHGRLLFSSNRGGKYALYTLSIATREATPLTQNASDERQPNSLNGKLLAYASNATGPWHIFTRALSGPDAADLTPDLASAQRPAWSPDGRRIAFDVTSSNITNIMVADARGQNRTQVTNGDAFDGQATFSPNGQRLAFAGQRGGQWDIYAVDVDGQNLARLTNDEAQDWQPAWSPDGGRIAFASTRSGGPQVYVMPANGNGPVTQLTDFPGGADQPAWSPDGNWLAFVGYSGDGEGLNQREIFLLYVPKDKPPLGGRGLVRLTQNAFDDTEPTWIGQ